MKLEIRFVGSTPTVFNDGHAIAEISPLGSIIHQAAVIDLIGAAFDLAGESDE